MSSRSRTRSRPIISHPLLLARIETELGHYRPARADYDRAHQLGRLAEVFRRPRRCSLGHRAPAERPRPRIRARYRARRPAQPRDGAECGTDPRPSTRPELVRALGRSERGRNYCTALITAPLVWASRNSPLIPGPHCVSRSACLAAPVPVGRTPSTSRGRGRSHRRWGRSPPGIPAWLAPGPRPRDAPGTRHWGSRARGGPGAPARLRRSGASDPASGRRHRRRRRAVCMTRRAAPRTGSSHRGARRRA